MHLISSRPLSFHESPKKRHNNGKGSVDYGFFFILLEPRFLIFKPSAFSSSFAALGFTRRSFAMHSLKFDIAASNSVLFESISADKSSSIFCRLLILSFSLSDGSSPALIKSLCVTTSIPSLSSKTI